MDEEQAVDRWGRVWRLKGELLQEDVERWNRVYVRLQPVGAAEQRGAQLRAGIVAGWIESPAVAVEESTNLATGKVTVRYLFDGVEVGKMAPREVAWYGRLCERAFAEATSIPDEEAKN